MTESSMSVVRNMIESLNGKIDEEIGLRMKAQEEHRVWFD
jgi:hypothetical protein